jgi:hypothetical protein
MFPPMTGAWEGYGSNDPLRLHVMKYFDVIISFLDSILRDERGIVRNAPKQESVLLPTTTKDEFRLSTKQMLIQQARKRLLLLRLCTMSI